MTPNDIEVLLHVHCSPEPHPRQDAPAVESTIDAFLHSGLIEPRVRLAGMYTTTERGKMLVEMLCATPWPEQRWVDPRTELKR